MRDLDFGIAMLKAKSAVKEKLLPGKILKESSPKSRLGGDKDLRTRIHLLFDSLLKNTPREKILLPSDKEIQSLRGGGLFLKR